MCEVDCAFVFGCVVFVIGQLSTVSVDSSTGRNSFEGFGDIITLPKNTYVSMDKPVFVNVNHFLTVFDSML